MKRNLLSEPPCESPRLRDFICARGCIVRLLHLESEFSKCQGDFEPHHEQFVSQGGDDYDLIGALCSCHHRMRHNEHPALTAFIVEHCEELKRLAISAWLNEIERLNGIAPAAQRKSKATARGKNIQPLTKRVGQFPNVERDS